MLPSGWKRWNVCRLPLSGYEACNVCTLSSCERGGGVCNKYGRMTCPTLCCRPAALWRTCQNHTEEGRHGYTRKTCARYWWWCCHATAYGVHVAMWCACLHGVFLHGAPCTRKTWVHTVRHGGIHCSPWENADTVRHGACAAYMVLFGYILTAYMPILQTMR